MQISPSFKSLLVKSFLLVWTISCVFLFIVYSSRISYVQAFVLRDWQSISEKILRIDLLIFMRDLLYATAGVMLFSLACLALGLQTLDKLAKSDRSIWALGATAFVFGEIILSLGFLTIISLYRLKPWIVTTSLLMVLLTGFRSLRSFFHRLPRLGLPIEFNRSEKVILILTIGVFTLGSIYSSARLGYDANAEYFSHAKIMAVSELPIFFYPADGFVVSSFHPGIIFTAIIQLFGDQAARMLPWINGLVIVILGLSIGKEVGLTPRAQLGFMVLMLTSTAFIDLFGDGKIELISTAPILAAVYWMLITVEQPNKGTFALIGLLVAFAIISRPYNIFLVSVFLLLFYASQIYTQNKAGLFNVKSFSQSAFWAVPPILILGVFHLLINWFLLGSPLAPLTYARNLNADAWQWQFDPANLNLYRLLYPFVLTFFNSPQSLGNISPLFVGFLPFLMLRDVRQDLQISSRLRSLTVAALFTIFAWISLSFTVVEIRYVWFLLVLLYLPISQIIESTTLGAEKLFQLLIYMIVIILLAYMGVRSILIAGDTYSPIGANGDAHCAGMLYCDFIQPVNQSASHGDRVLVLNSYRYYLRSDLFACSSRVDEYAKLQNMAHQSNSDFWVEVYKLGYRFIIFEKHLAEQRFYFGALPDPNSAPGWIHIKLLFSEPLKNQRIYMIETTDAPIPPEINCRRDAQGIWQLTSPATAQP
jgi:hypothetical protein